MNTATHQGVEDRSHAPRNGWMWPRHWAEIPWCFSVRAVPVADAHTVGTRALIRPGDLVLAEVVRIGQHRRLQLASGRYRSLNNGDLFVAAAGCRYAVDQFEGHGEIRPADTCSLLAGGGVVGVVQTRHDAMSTPTEVRVIGVVQDATGKRLNLSRRAHKAAGADRPERVIGVVGTGMNAGKTTAAAGLIRGLHRAGLRVAGIKASGTGSFGDVQAYEDAGAHWVGDFGLTGMASTYRQPLERVSSSIETLTAMASLYECDAAVVELADGLLQEETRALLTHPRTRALFDGILFAAGDPLGALGGLALLEQWGWRPLAISGLLTRAPLAVRELQSVSGIEVWTRDELADPALANRFVLRLEQAEANH